MEDYRVFYVTSWGYAADHLFGWFPKALNCHRDIFALLAHEGSRPKYLNERTRAERPPLGPFTEFLNDMGMTYSAIGDCYSYRAGQMPELLEIDRYKAIPVANLTRHPVSWLEFYMRWRASNMRMRAEAIDPLAWEWKVTCHAYFEFLGLHKYTKDDIEVWASYQGMFQLNNVLGDIAAVSCHLPIEKVANAPDVFKELVTYLSGGKVEFNQEDLDRAYSMRHTLFRGESEVDSDPDQLMEGWPGWKVDAFRKIVSPQAIEAYKSFGYEFKDLLSLKVGVDLTPGKMSRAIFVSSIPKSGTWLLREIIEMLTSLKSFEPKVHPGSPPNYANDDLIEFPSDAFFSWHSVITKKTAAMLTGCQSKNIFLVRNIYDVLLSMRGHLIRDVDAIIGRSILGSDYFDGMSVEQSLTLLISGFSTPKLTFGGVRPFLKQMESFLDLVESGQALLLTYCDLTDRKLKTIQRISEFLGCEISNGRIHEIATATDKQVMRERRKEFKLDQHITLPELKLQRSEFKSYHHDMMTYAIVDSAPNLRSRLDALGMGDLLYAEYVETTKLNLVMQEEMKTSAFDMNVTALISTERTFPCDIPFIVDTSIVAREVFIELDIFIEEKIGTQTIIDFMHDENNGFVLQYESGSEGGGELCWHGYGISLVAQIQTGCWQRIEIGFDTINHRLFMQLNGGDVIIGDGREDIAAMHKTSLGIGLWLKGGGREFIGRISRLNVRGLIHATEEGSHVTKFKESIVHFFKREKGSPKSIEGEVFFPSIAGVKNRMSSELLQIVFSSSVHSDLSTLDELLADHVNLLRDIKEFVRYVEKDDVIGAAYHINAILDADYSVIVNASSKGSLHVSVLKEAQDLSVMQASLLKENLNGCGNKGYWALLSVFVACAQTLFRRGFKQNAAEFLSGAELHNGSQHVLTDVHLAQNWPSESREPLRTLVNNLAVGGLDYQKVFNGKYCQQPYGDLEVRSDGETFVCCPSYLPISIGNIYKVNSPDELIASPMHRKILDSIENQDFRYCRWLHCKKILGNSLPSRTGATKTEYQTVDIRLSYDSSCNLWCPSCRKEKIVVTGAERDRLLRLTDNVILPLLQNAETCMMNGYGDIFFSRACRRILEESNSSRYPNLKFHFITNAILLTPAEWKKFPGIHDMVDSIRVSIDAASKSVYEEVRLGGKWEILQENLEFISSLRKRSVIKQFSISFVIQECNFQEMADFSLMAIQLGCDRVIFEPIMDWGVSSREEFLSRAVHYQSHPKNQDYLRMVDEVRRIFSSENLSKLVSPGSIISLAGF